MNSQICDWILMNFMISRIFLRKSGNSCAAPVLPRLSQRLIGTKIPSFLTWSRSCTAI